MGATCVLVPSSGLNATAAAMPTELVQERLKS